jgi:Leucine-rich repeat (LRR) protein
LDNQALSGPIPAEPLTQLTYLQELKLSNNSFTDTIPAALATLPNLSILTMANNQLTGPIPEEFNRMQKLYNM